MTMLPTLDQARRGQVLVIVALTLVLILLVAGLVLDYGVWQVQQRNIRNAADSAAQAGVSELVQKPVTTAKQLNAATHAMEYLNNELSLGMSATEVSAAASNALYDANGFGAEDLHGYDGKDHFVIRTPVTADVSCTGASWGQRALTVRVYHSAPRFLSRLFFQGDQPVNACATASLETGGYAIAVLKPNSGTQPNGQNITMKLGGTNTFVRVCGGDVGINSIFGGGPEPPPNSPQEPAFVKFMKPTSDPACTIDGDNEMLMTVDNPSPPSWSATAKQVRVEGPTSALADDVYQAPKHLPDYIQIPPWGQSEYSALITADGTDPVLRLGSADPGEGSCQAPAGFDPVKPGKYDLIRTGTSTGQIAQRWLCPGTYHFVPTNGQQGLQLGSGTTVAGEGVTLVFETGPNHNSDDSVISIQSGSALLLNAGAVPGTSQTDAPWTTGDPRHDVPIAIWIKPNAACPVYPVASCSASSVFEMGSGSGLDIGGVIFGPTDNMMIAGNGDHHGAGEIWSWTIEYVGNSQLDQTYSGTDEGWPVLVE